MNIFKSIEDNLNEFAKKHNAKLYAREVGFDSKPIGEPELRKVLWDDGMFSKAILILPAAPNYNGSDSTLWDFSIHASVNDNRPGDVPSWQKDLLEGVPFQEIERQIDHLLSESENYLAAVRVEDMRLTWGHIKWPDGRIDLI